MDLQDEMVRSKRVLDEKHYEANKLGEESIKKANDNADLREQANRLEREIDMIKS